MDYENGLKNIFGLSIVLELGLLFVRKYIKNQSYPNMLIVKVGLLFLYSTMKKKSERLRKILTQKNYFENQNSAVFDLQL